MLVAPVVLGEECKVCTASIACLTVSTNRVICYIDYDLSIVRCGPLNGKAPLKWLTHGMLTYSMFQKAVPGYTHPKGIILVNTHSVQPVPMEIPSFSPLLFPGHGGASVDDRYPHSCPRCGAAAYIGLNDVEHHDGSFKCRN